MGQQEIIEFLENKRACMPNNWFTTKEIKNELKHKTNPKYIRKGLIKLWIFNIVKFKGKHILDNNATFIIED